MVSLSKGGVFNEKHSLFQTEVFSRMQKTEVLTLESLNQVHHNIDVVCPVIRLGFCNAGFLVLGQNGFEVHYINKSMSYLPQTVAQICLEFLCLL